MTHEEAVVHLCRSEVNSHRQLPVMLYQIQTKYRDEARPRAGLIRVREFTMKDAYSFHTSQDCLEAYYKRAHKAYENIFRRVGLKDVLSIESNSGMMGGKVSHEFMAVADCGEDTIFVSPDGSYRANREIARAAWTYTKEEPKALEKVHTPGKKTIEEVAAFLGLKPENTGKVVFYKDSDGGLVLAMTRGDFEINESKLQNHLKTPSLEFAGDDLIRTCGAEPGYASPMLPAGAKVRVVIDRSAAESSNLVVGANEPDWHYKNFNCGRDLKDADVADIVCVREGDPCPVTGKPLLLKRGIEVGNIFQLGVKYSEPMACRFLDAEGKSHPMIMGCYGIGVGRTMASVIEQSHDEYGPVWPMSISPHHVHICALNPQKEGVGEASEKLYNDLTARGVEVLYDDRGEKAGFMFNDADLTGIPLRLIISPKTLAERKIEFKIRGEKQSSLIDLDGAAERVSRMVSEELAKYSR
jgi:prolyl-tRNA synthetase